MAFEVYKMGKLGDHLESEAYNWVAHQIKETFDIDPGMSDYGYANDIVGVMTEDHVKQIEEYLESDGWIEGYAQMALRSICDRWYEENET